MSAQPALERLRTALRDAMRNRDRAATTALRSVLAAVDNAGAVPLGETDRAGAIEQAARGAFATEAPRRELTATDIERIIDAEINERRDAAAGMRAHGQDARAALLDAEADAIAAAR